MAGRPLSLPPPPSSFPQVKIRRRTFYTLPAYIETSIGHPHTSIHSGYLGPSRVYIEHDVTFLYLYTVCRVP